MQKIKKRNSTLNANLTCHNEIAQDGSKGAIGTAIISDRRFESIVASMTHGGVLDSEKQMNPNDPVWHNHFVKLPINNTIGSKCGNDPQVEELTFRSPGNLSINNTNVQISDISHKFDVINSLNNSSLSFVQGNVIDKVVTVRLQSQFNAQCS